jgi:tetratricopeptide (TPR) repeat protein
MPVEFSSVPRALPLRGSRFCRRFSAIALAFCLLSTGKNAGLRASGQTPSPQVLFRDAEAADARGDVQEAIRLYREFLQANPDSVEARTNLGVALSRIGLYNDAIVQYDAALKRAPDNPVILLNRALAWYKQAAFERAAAELAHLRLIDSGNRQSLYLLADCYLRLGRNADTVALLQPSYAADPEDRAVEFALGMALIRTGQIQEGTAIIDRVIRSGSQSEVDLLTGAAQLAAHDSKAASFTIHKALVAAPDLPGGWSLYGRALLDSGDRESARTSFQRALQADPNDFDANLYLGGMLRYDGRIDEASAYLEKALMLRPASVEARFQTGLLNLAKGRMDDALSDLEKVERQSPEFQEVHVQLAVLYTRLHRQIDSERERSMVLQLNHKASEQAPLQPQP